MSLLKEATTYVRRLATARYCRDVRDQGKQELSNKERIDGREDVDLLWIR